MASQTINGKAFEFALLTEFKDRLTPKTTVSVIESEPYKTAQKCFNSFTEEEQGHYRLVSSFAVNFLIDIEPRVVQLELDKNGNNKRIEHYIKS